MCCIRSCVFTLPHRLRNASRSRSSRYCSDTFCVAAQPAAAQNVRQFLADHASYSLMYPPSRARNTPIFSSAKPASPATAISCARRAGRIAGAHRERSRLGIGDQALRVHRDAVGSRAGGPVRAHSAPLADTLAKPMVSKIVFNSPPRSTISLQPPPAGIRPTPTSTRPM